jgi:hypothetical protein
MVQDVTPELLLRGLKLDCMVCDMNAPPDVVVDVLIALLPVINVGATIVLTFKNFVGRKVALLFSRCLWLLSVVALCSMHSAYAQMYATMHRLRCSSASRRPSSVSGHCWESQE